MSSNNTKRCQNRCAFMWRENGQIALYQIRVWIKIFNNPEGFTITVFIHRIGIPYTENVTRLSANFY